MLFKKIKNMIRILLFLMCLLSWNSYSSQEKLGKVRKYTSISAFQGVGWSTKAEFVNVRNPKPTFGLLLEHCSAIDFLRSGFVLSYLRIPYQLEYYSAGIIGNSYYIWRSEEETVTHSLQAGFPFHYLVPTKNGRGCFKLAAIGGFNFLERKSESRTFILVKDDNTNLWLPAERNQELLNSNQSRDVTQWRLSFLFSYGVEKVISTNKILSYNFHILALTGGSPTGPFLAFKNSNTFPKNEAGEPRTQILKDMTYMIGFGVGVAFSNLQENRDSIKL